MLLHVVLACHNRRDLTVRAISTFSRSAAIAGVEADFTVFDDGSTDGTAEAIESLDLPITRILGDGSAFWARGMAEAESHVLRLHQGRRRHQDVYVVWLNDDVELDDDALEVALAAARMAPSAIVVGAMRAPDTGRLTYSGLRRRGVHPLSFDLAEPSGRLQMVDAFNGNFVFVPMELACKLGGIDGGFSHALADIDYGVRARRLGVDLILLPRVVGTCAHPPVESRKRIIDDWRAYVGVKGRGEYRSMKRILQKWHERSWAAYIAISYSLWWFRRLTHAVAPRANRHAHSGRRGSSC